MAAPPASYAKLFLGGISPNTTTEAIEAHFAKYGNVIDAVVMYKDGKHRGFGFVTFDNMECINDVLAEDQVIDGRTVDAKPAVPQGEAPPPRSNGIGDYTRPLPLYLGASSRGYEAALPAPTPGPAPGGVTDKVFVGGLAQTTTDDMVREYFSQYGTIIDCVVMKDRGSMRSRGFGFVQFDDPLAVDAIMADYANHNIDGKWIEVKKAIPQDQMPPPSTAGRPPPSRGGGYNGYSGYAAGGKGQPLWPGRMAYGPPPVYPSYPPAPHYGMPPYDPYAGYPSYAPPGSYGGPSRSGYRTRPY